MFHSNLLTRSWDITIWLKRSTNHVGHFPALRCHVLRKQYSYYSIGQLFISISYILILSKSSYLTNVDPDSVGNKFDLSTQKLSFVKKSTSRDLILTWPTNYCRDHGSSALRFLNLGNSLHLKKKVIGFEKKRRVYDFSEIADWTKHEEKVHYTLLSHWFICYRLAHGHMRHIYCLWNNFASTLSHVKCKN